jgi:ribosome modulation factor
VLPDEPAAETEPDDIAEIAEKIKADPNRSFRACQQSWERGYESAIDEHSLETFPDLPLPQLEDWVRGWVTGSETDFSGL